MKINKIICLLALFSGFVACTTKQNSPKTNSDEQQLFIGDSIAIAKTEYGKVKGFILRGIVQFRGIPYGDNAGGENRFMPPRPPKSWEGILPAVWWGNSAPQIMDGRFGNNYYTFTDHWNYDEISEDCLKLNVWTPSVDGKKRPVLVWLHGGGYTNGNGIEQDGYNGENISRKGDIVFVSINHRLGPLGFTDLSGVGGEKYKYSGNAGVLDMIFALQWVNKNISNFGGDPGNVTVMGQSGGGSKVCNLLATEKTSGLIHKAVALSGSSINSADQEQAQLLGKCVLEESGLKPEQIDSLQRMPWKDYLLLARKGAQKYATSYPDKGRAGFGPVADGEILPKETNFSSANTHSNTIPLMLCTNMHEWNMSKFEPEREKMSMDDLVQVLKEQGGRGENFGDKAQEIVNAYKESFPDATPVVLHDLIVGNRKRVVQTANAKASQEAAVYMAWYGWKTPLHDQRLRAFHCLDISFWFYNTDLMLTHTGGGKRPRDLAEKMSSALIQFMRTGNPNTGGLPLWPAYSIENGETMILDDISEVKNDPDRQARATL